MIDMPLDEAYFTWLYSQVGSVKLRNLSKSYWTLLRMLYEKEFTWDERRMAKDGNRAEDGKDLRLQFMREKGMTVTDAAWLHMPCSVLEMLVALAFKIAFQGGGEQDERFWEMIENLGLLECNDAYPPNPEIVDQILDKVIDRDYAPNGAGGLFPLPEPVKDQRGVELWYQANAYLLERL
jgi:hypothetical protein